MDKFKEIKIGQSVELSRQITEADLQKFVDLTGDNNPLHIDAMYAGKTSFKKRVVHGMLASSFISTVIGTKLPGTGSLWLSQTLEFIMPVRVGDTIKIIATVKHKSLSQRIVVIEIIMFNQNGQKILEGESRVKVLMEAENAQSAAAFENVKILSPTNNVIQDVLPTAPLPKDSVNLSQIANQQEDLLEMNNQTKGAAIITGASGGIGAAIALKLAQDGFGVVVNFHGNEEEAKTVLQQIIAINGRGVICQGDVSNYADAVKIMELACNKFGAIDVLVNNASSKILSHSFDQLSWESIQVHLDVQLKGSFNMCKVVIPTMLKQKKGKIINIGSIVSDNVPPLKWYGYSIAKSALASFTKSLAVEFGPKGLNINSVSPGMTETTLIADIPEKVKMVTEMQTPLRRIAKPDDIANVVSFLVSDAANYLTGETIRVCGGQIML